MWSYFRGKFGIDIHNRFAGAISKKSVATSKDTACPEHAATCITDLWLAGTCTSFLHAGNVYAAARTRVPGYTTLTCRFEPKANAKFRRLLRFPVRS
jgi:hypothetical protein